ncbi:hypothetical protein ACJIZ3_012414 [Penstemon smallii]|uniref:Uncharacterized protein n=1 Tax=Penstemon smallii TaxID=265156 RepID=A0ABD3ULY9_9LAMI
MGDKATLSKARKELEELYLGVPDDSVNLTFQDLAQVRQKKPISSPENSSQSSLTKLPSLDFSKALESSFQSPNNIINHHINCHYQNPQNLHHQPPVEGDFMYGHDRRHYNHHENLHSVDQRSMAYDDDASYMSHVAYGTQERGGRRRPGIPHSNICALCCNYIYIFRHRCLVCGRVYCRQCVNIGMGEMTEGRKCVECLGKRFSQRYIQKAGNVGCCMLYPSTVKHQELKWAEKGPRRSGENRYRNSVMVSRSRSPVVTPNGTHSPSNPPSFVKSSTYSPTSHHPLPF